MKKSKGITLIALVITIVILIILAGVTIATLSGPNGILTNANKAKEDTKRAEIVEQIKLGISSKIIDTLGKQLTEQQLLQIVSEYGTIEEKNGEKVIVTTEGYEIKLSDIYAGNVVKRGKTIQELYNGFNDPSDVNYHDNALHIGDYVNYPVNYTNQGPTYGDTQYLGWRVWDISEDKTTMTLISAGCPETFYFEYQGGTEAENLLKSRDWNSYKNNDYDVSLASTITKLDLEQWYKKYIDNHSADFDDSTSIPLNTENKLLSLIRNGIHYYLATAYSDGDTLWKVGPSSWNPDMTKIIWADAGQTYGLRVLVTLNANVRINETPEKLSGNGYDGFTYNKWTIVE